MCQENNKSRDNENSELGKFPHFVLCFSLACFDLHSTAVIEDRTEAILKK